MCVSLHACTYTWMPKVKAPREWPIVMLNRECWMMNVEWRMRASVFSIQEMPYFFPKTKENHCGNRAPSDTRNVTQRCHRLSRPSASELSTHVRGFPVSDNIHDTNRSLQRQICIATTSTESQDSSSNNVASLFCGRERASQASKPQQIFRFHLGIQMLSTNMEDHW